MEEPIQIPHQFLCPISTELMQDPVIAGDGITYQRKFIQEWMRRSNDSPFTGKRLPHKTVITNYALKNTIQNFTLKMPQIMKQNQIKIDLQYAIKIKEDQVKSFMDKIEQKNAKFQKQDELKILRIKQLSSHQQTRKSYQQTKKSLKQALNKLKQSQDRCMALQSLLQQFEKLNQQVTKYKDLKNKKIQRLSLEINIDEKKQEQVNLSLKVSQVINSDEKKFIIQKVQEFMKKNIQVTKLVFKWEQKQKTKFTNLLKQLKNFIIIFKTIKTNYKFGFFIEKVSNDQDKSHDAFLFSITNKKCFYRKIKTSQQIKNCWFMFGGLVIYFGNKQIRLKEKDNTIKINSNTLNRCFDIQNMQQLVGPFSQQIIWNQMEIHSFQLI